MEISFKGILFFIFQSSALVQMTVFKARIQTSTSIIVGREGKPHIPDHVSLDIITDSELFSFNLRRSYRQHRRIPIITNARNTFQRHDFEMHKNGASIFGMKNASFTIRFASGNIHSCRGYFYTQNYVYTVYPDNENNTSHMIQRHPHDAFVFSVEDIISADEEILPMTKIPLAYNPMRTKRQTRLYEIELFIVVDFALFTQLSSLKHAETNSSDALEEVLEDVVHQFSIIVSGIDARFKGMHGTGYVIDVVFVGIYIAQTESSSSWSEAVKEESSNRPIVNESSMKLFIDWMKGHQHSFPEFDHAMAFTAYNLRKGDNHKTLGLGYTQSMCTDRRFSIVEHHGDFAYVSYIATHELAHSLGAKHDGYPARVVYGDRAKTCLADDGYIMGPKASRDIDSFIRKWQFSDCSVLYFDFFIDHLIGNKTNCMTKSSSWYVGKDSTMYVEDNPKVYDPDEQCERRHGEGFVLDRKAVGKNISSICHSIPCINPSARELPTLPVEGTVCGHSRMCHLGRCVDDRNNLHYEEKLNKGTCVFGDQPGVIAGTDQNCQDLLGPLDFAYRCYMYEQQCCNMCARHRRQFTAIVNCTYGDKKSSCSATDCDTSLCCETCAALAGKISECPILNSPRQGNVTFNTRSVQHGTVATYSCSSGHQLAGNRTVICLKNGTWDSASPKCLNGCMLPKEHPHTLIENAKYDFVEFGSMIRIKCENGFDLEGNHTIDCKKDTSWDDIFPKCKLAFTSPSTINIPENTRSGSIVHQVLTGNASSVYRLLYLSHPGFQVTKDGSVEVDENGAVNFEDVQSYTLIIEATSKQDSRFKAKQRLVIHVEDVNEFEPKFIHERYCNTLQQPLIEGMFVFTGSAADEDASGFNISYELQSSAEIADMFRIDSFTGVITVSNAERLNDTGYSVYMLKILATDSGKPQLTGSCVVQVNYGQECQQNSATALNCFYLQNFIFILHIVIYSVYLFELFCKRTSRPIR